MVSGSGLGGESAAAYAGSGRNHILRAHEPAFAEFMGHVERFLGD